MIYEDALAKVLNNNVDQGSLSIRKLRGNSGFFSNSLRKYFSQSWSFN